MCPSSRLLYLVLMEIHTSVLRSQLGPLPLPRGSPLPLGARPPPLPPLVGILPLVGGTLDLLVVLAAAAPGVVGGPPNVDFRLGVAFRLAKLVSPVPKVVSSPLPPLALASIVEVSRPSFWRCCFCHRLIESLSGACRRQ